MNSIITPQDQAIEDARQLLRRQISSRHEEERKRAGIWRRLLIRLKVEREVQRELKRRFPPGALYASHSVR